MPRYCYYCNNCDKQFIIFHGINEVMVDCKECDSIQSLKKMISKPLIVKNLQNNKEKITGNLTHEYIESNREILQKQKKELKGKEYEPS